jgi:hypothetical protein
MCQELLSSLLKKLVTEQPEDPLDFLIKKLRQVPIRKKMCLIGPPGAYRNLSAEAIVEAYPDWVCISAGALISAEIENKEKSPIGARCSQYRKSF